MKRQSILITAAVSALALSAANAAEPGHQMDHPAEHKMGDGDHCGVPMGEGVINALDVRKSKVNITHKPIEAIGWSEMTMDFAVLKPVDLTAFAPGERIHFLLKETKEKSYAIAMVCSLDADKGAHEACMSQLQDTAMKIADEAGMPCPMDGMDHMKGMGHGDDDADDGEASEDHSGHH